MVACDKFEAAFPAEEADLADVGGSWSRVMGGVRVWPFVDSKWEFALVASRW